MSQTRTYTSGAKPRPKATQLQIAVGETVRKLRKERGLTLRDMSSRAYMALGYLSQVENGDRNVSNEFLENIAKGLDITITSLVYEIYAYLEENEIEQA